jgi:hypothetical protein
LILLFHLEYCQVIFYRRVPTEEQIKDLLRKKNFKEAVSLVEELKSDGEISNEMLSFVHAQIGFLLLFDLHFEEAVNHFLQSETMQPSEVFPFIMRDPNRWSLLVCVYSFILQDLFPCQYFLFDKRWIICLPLVSLISMAPRINHLSAMGSFFISFSILCILQMPNS